MALLDHFRLDGKVAIVTGASSGLGVGIAIGLAEAGADVVLAARREDRLVDTAALVQQRGRRAVTVRTDISRPDDCTRVVDETMEAFGRVDALVNNAGIVGEYKPAVDDTVDNFASVIDTNLKGSYWMAQACARVMDPGSTMVNVSSVVAVTTMKRPAAGYASSKSGLLGLTRDLAAQLAGDRGGIRVNAILPGIFLTEMTEDYTDEYLDRALRARVPIGRLGRAEDVAGLVVFLVSAASSYITGAAIPVDGGLLLL